MTGGSFFFGKLDFQYIADSVKLSYAFYDITIGQVIWKDAAFFPQSE